MRGSSATAAIFSTAVALALFIQAAAAQTPIVQVEEDVYTLTSPNNGSGPLWNRGCTVIVRIGDDVYASQMETGENIEPLSNTRWRILRRRNDEWTTFAQAGSFRQREPCPIAVTGDNTLNLYVNDSQGAPGEHYNRCFPHVLRFNVDAPTRTIGAVIPDLGVPTSFTDHSYRGYASDRATQSLLMVNIDSKTSEQHYALIDRHGVTQANGAITFPIRSCYQQVALKDGAAYMLAISDIVEPIEAWRTFKFDQTGRKWDYVFRRLFYTTASNLKEGGFNEPIEISNVDATAGYIANQDLWISPEGEAHILYTERETQTGLLRDEFFPDASILNSLHLAIMRKDGTIERHVVMEGTEERQPGHSRFHETPNGNLYVLLNVTGANGGNKLLQIRPNEPSSPQIDVPFKTPFTSFVLATDRAGNVPSNTIDVFGFQAKGDTMAYGRISLE